MRRALARLGLLLLLAGSPIVFVAVVGAPAVPDFRGSDGISGSFVPVDAVLRLLGLLSWGLWAYLMFAVLLHAAATVAGLRGARGERALVAASFALTPKVVRSLVEIAIGGTLVAASLSVHVSSAVPAVRAPLAIGTESAPSASADLPSRSKPSAPTRETYRVKPGDSLWRIAERSLGSGFRWREIYRLNEGRRFSDGRSLNDPHLIRPGWMLELPEAHRSSHSPTDSSEYEPPAVGTTPAPTSPPEEATPSPVPSPLPPPDTAHEDPDSDTEAADSATTPPADPALQIPSGLLVAASFASGLLTAHLLGRLHQRRTRRLSDASSLEPGAVPELIHDLRRAGASEMAGPIDIAIGAVIEAWRAHAGSWPNVLGAIEAGRRVSVLLRANDGSLPPATGGTISPRVRFGHAGSTEVAEVDGPFPLQLREPRSPLEGGLLLPLGRASDGSVVHASATGLGRISVTGPEAARLARQLAIAASTTGGRDDLQLILLGPGTDMESLRGLPQTTTTSGWEDARPVLRQVELEFLRRARLFVAEDAEDIRDHLAAHSDERLPALLIVCEQPPPSLTGTIEAIARQAQALGAAVVALGWALSGSELQIHAGSSVELRTDLPLPRTLEPFQLDAAAEREAIEIIRRAHPPGSAEPAAPEEREDAPPEVAAFPPAAARSLMAPRGPGEEPQPPPARAPVSSPEPPLPPPAEPPETPPGVLAIRCLGPFEVRRDGRTVPAYWRTKGREMVAYLAAHPAGAPKERIVEELWPEIEPRKGAARFDQYATVVRSKARGTQDSRMYIERVGESAYRLETDAWWVDAWEFERLNREAERTQGATGAIARFRDAVALYQGEFCDDAYYPWLEPVRERYRNLFVAASGRLAYLLSEAGEHDQALAVLDRAIRADPVCEDLVRRAIAVEATLGRRAAALARYRRLEATLDAELEVEPDPETRELVEQLVRGRSASGRTA